MCAIFGSRNTSMFEVLYEGNKPRGVFASSIYTLIQEKGEVVDTWIGKFEGNVDLNKLSLQKDEQAYLLGHVQAPTGRSRKWNYDTAHPFEFEGWTIAHNGIITNSIELNASHTPWNVNPVDSAVIGAMLQEETIYIKSLSQKKEIGIICKVLERLEGTFSLYIVNETSNNIYIARQGSTLFFDNKGNFSSVKGKSMIEVPEGILFQLTDNYSTFKEVCKFSSKSPFFVL